MGRILRSAFHGGHNNVFDLLGSDHRRTPGRGSSLSPSRRCSTKRERHFVTIGAEHPTKVATSLLGIPPAQARTMRERNAKAWEDFRLRVHREGCSRSSSVRMSSDLGRPARSMNPFQLIEWISGAGHQILRSLRADRECAAAQPSWGSFSLQLNVKPKREFYALP